MSVRYGFRAKNTFFHNSIVDFFDVLYELVMNSRLVFAATLLECKFNSM